MLGCRSQRRIDLRQELPDGAGVRIGGYFFSAQAEHQPFGATEKPGKIEHPLVAAMWNWQLSQKLSGVRVD